MVVMLLKRFSFERMHVALSKMNFVFAICTTIFVIIISPGIMKFALGVVGMILCVLTHEIIKDAKEQKKEREVC